VFFANYSKERKTANLSYKKEIVMTKISKRALENPSGFLDLIPQEAIAQQKLLDTIRKYFEEAGYVPIETPLVERPEVLFAKAEGEIKNQVYGLRLMNPSSDATDDVKNLSLRFDQTVPLARFVAAHQRELLFPFRRYVIGPVFRGERAKDGRYRQFTQADIDVIGDETLSILHDAEIVSVISRLFTALNIGSFTIRVGHRKVLQGLLQSSGLSREEDVKQGLFIIDALEKVGLDKVEKDLVDLGVDKGKVSNLIKILTDKLTTDETLSLLSSIKSDNQIFIEGREELLEVIQGVRSFGVTDDQFILDLSIARGLDYYTGTVYETRLDKHPDLGSIASGGRYENLAENFSNKSFPGVGISIGVTRLLKRLLKAGLLTADVSTIAPVLVTIAVEDSPICKDYCLHIADVLRRGGLAAEIYLAKKALGKQLQFASRRGFRIAIIAFEEQAKNDKITVRDMENGEQTEVALDKAADVIKQML